jgi:carbonic anhydrase
MRIIEITYQYDLDADTERAQPADADAARRRFDERSQAFANLIEQLGQGEGTSRRVIHVDPGDLGLSSDDRGAPKQRPFAAVVGCSDARVPIELVFNEGLNDLFVVRVVG